MPQHDPIATLMSQGYPENIAQQMVSSGVNETMQQPTLDFGQIGQAFGGSGGAPTLPGLGGDSEAVNPELQSLLDQGYTLEEATQLMQSPNYNPQKANEANAGPLLGKDEQEMGMTPQSTGAGLLDFASNAGTGVSLDQAAQGLGQSIGSGNPLGIAANAGKLVIGGARQVLSGLGSAKRDKYIEEYYDKEQNKNTYTAAPQSGNTNYLGGNSYGEDGGIQGETLPLKNFLTNKGFQKPGFKKLM